MNAPTFDAMSAANLAAERARDAFTAALLSRPGDAERVNVMAIPGAGGGTVVIIVGAPSYSLTIRTDGREVMHYVAPATAKLTPTSRGARVLAAVRERVDLAADVLETARAAAAATRAHREATLWTVRALDGVTVEYHATARGAQLARDVRYPGAIVTAPLEEVTA